MILSAADAIEKLNELRGQELEELAKKYNVPTHNEKGIQNKQWKGHLFELYLGGSINSRQEPDFDWGELKLVKQSVLKKTGKLSFNQTVKMTMIDKSTFVEPKFEDSHLYHKIKDMVVVGWLTKNGKSFYHGAVHVKLDDVMLNEIKLDYELIPTTRRTKGWSALTGYLGKWVQPRTAGTKVTNSRAYFARKLFLITHCPDLLI